MFNALKRSRSNTAAAEGSPHQIVVRVELRHRWERLRRAGDVTIACAILLITLPLLALVAAAVRLEDGGPVFDRRQRIGPSGHLFTLLKFRTTPRSLGHDFGPGWARHTTHAGGFLRYTRIEDLPQLINVLRGEMTLIRGGPRQLYFFD
jgi:lipopolysaccharide/colanic/teichoic acid biosynthesis glycosyltransferase